MINLVLGYIIYYRCHVREKKQNDQSETVPNEEDNDSDDEQAEIDALLTEMGANSRTVPSAPPSAEPNAPEPLFPRQPVYNPALRGIQQEDQPPRYSQLASGEEDHRMAPPQHPSLRGIQEQDVEAPPRYSQAVREDTDGRLSQPPRYSHAIK